MKKITPIITAALLASVWVFTSVAQAAEQVDSKLILIAYSGERDRPFRAS